ncbi:MAG: hypothetical protein FWB71_00130 [Defluviitaleaceae bacterium]|nr:hypothetical protein [Defluviitaleaceae bacterium]
MDKKDGLPPAILTVVAMILLVFFAIGIGGLVLFAFYLMAVMSLIWTGFAYHGPLVGLLMFAIILAFFVVLGLFVHHMFTSKIDKNYDRGDNHDNY